MVPRTENAMFAGRAPLHLLSAWQAATDCKQADHHDTPGNRQALYLRALCARLAVRGVQGCGDGCAVTASPEIGPFLGDTPWQFCAMRCVGRVLQRVARGRSAALAVGHTRRDLHLCASLCA